MADTFVKAGVAEHEVAMHRRALAGGIPAPEILSWDPAMSELTMSQLPGMSVSDFYGEEAEAVPARVFAKVRELVVRLVDGAGLDYPDLTGYNIMVDGDRMWIVDFEHARPVTGRPDCCAFVRGFLGGRDGWNLEFG